jgi:hypothetical protein
MAMKKGDTASQQKGYRMGEMGRDGIAKKERKDQKRKILGGFTH